MPFSLDLRLRCIPERQIGSLEIVMIQPIGDLDIRFVKRHEIILPDVLLLEDPGESDNHSVLLLFFDVMYSL